MEQGTQPISLALLGWISFEYGSYSAFITMFLLAFITTIVMFVSPLIHIDIRGKKDSLGAISNIPLPNDEWKINPTDVGDLIVSLSKLHSRVLPAYVELRPSKPQQSPVTGIARLQYI